MPISTRLDKEVVHIYTGLLVSHKKLHLTICDNMYGPRGIMWSEKVTQRKTNIIWFYLYVISKNQNKQNKQSHRYTEQNDGHQMGGGGGDGWKRWRDWEVQLS